MAYDTTYCRRIVDGNNKLVRQWKAQNGTILYEDPFYIPFYIHNLGSSACTITVKQDYGAANFNLYYSTNARSSWTTLSFTGSNQQKSFSIPAKTTAFVRGTINPTNTAQAQFLGATQNIDLGGNLASLYVNNNYTTNTTQIRVQNLFVQSFTTHIKNVARLACPHCTLDNAFATAGSSPETVTFTTSPIFYSTTIVGNAYQVWPITTIICTGKFQTSKATNLNQRGFTVNSTTGTVYCPTNVTFANNTQDKRFASTSNNTTCMLPKNWTYSQKSILNVTS